MKDSMHSPIDLFVFVIMFSLNTIKEKPLEVFFNFSFIASIRKYLMSVSVKTAADDKAERALQKLRETYNGLYKNAMGSLKILLSRKKIFNFEYKSHLIEYVMFTEITNEIRQNQVQMTTLFQHEINKYLLTNWIKKIESENMYMNLLSPIKKLQSSGCSEPIYSYFEGESAIFTQREYYDHFLESVIESIVNVMDQLNHSFSNNIDMNMMDMANNMGMPGRMGGWNGTGEGYPVYENFGDSDQDNSNDWGAGNNFGDGKGSDYGTDYGNSVSMESENLIKHSSMRNN